MAQKRALLVFPDYGAVHGLSDRQQFVMQQAGVLPPSLGKYTPLGAAADRDRLLAVLGHGFATTLICAEVTARDVAAQLRLLLARETSVAVFAFCGHGVCELAAGQHGSMVCSFNQRVTAASIDSIVAERQFRGTFVCPRIMNMCDGSAHTFECNASVQPCGRARRDVAAAARVPLAAYRSLVISASAPFTKAYGNSTGSYLAKAMAALFAKQQVVTYEALAALVAALDAKLEGCSASATPGLCGMFGCKAFQVSRPCTSAALHSPHAPPPAWAGGHSTQSCQSESDEEL